MVTVILVHNVLLLAFGVGILRVATRRSLGWIGILQVVDFVVVGLTTHTVWAMSARDLETGFNDTMHIASSMVFSVIVVAMMVLSAVAYRGWFRVYALATAAVVMGFGMASAVAIQGIDENDTPWAGAFERINAYAYFAWLAVLAVMVIRHELSGSRESDEAREATVDGASRRRPSRVRGRPPPRALRGRCTTARPRAGRGGRARGGRRRRRHPLSPGRRPAPRAGHPVRQQP